MSTPSTGSAPRKLRRKRRKKIRTRKNENIKALFNSFYHSDIFTKVCVSSSAYSCICCMYSFSLLSQPLLSGGLISILFFFFTCFHFIKILLFSKTSRNHSRICLRKYVLVRLCCACGLICVRVRLFMCLMHVRLVRSFA